MKFQRFYSILFMSFSGVLGLLGVMILTWVLEPDRLEPRMAWNSKDIALRLTIHSTCGGKVKKRIPAIEVVKKDKGTIIMVRSYVPEMSRDLFPLTEFAANSDVLWQREAFCRSRSGRDPSEISESNGRWGPV